MKKIAAPRGTADVYPPEGERWQALEACARAIARRYGYGEIRTPTFEATELFVRGVGETSDIVSKEMYDFVDKGGRNLTLRPEWTAPVVRALLEHNLLTEGPQRLYYIGSIYRYERPQAGRYRQSHQFGVECFGYAGPEADVEVIALAHDVMRENDVPVRLALNSIGDEVCRPRYRKALYEYFAPHRDALSAASQERLERNPLRILDSKEAQDRELVGDAPTMLDVLCEPCAAHFAMVRALLEASGIAFTIDPGIVRGLDYYTRTVFEFISDELGAQSTVCGGGRYDGLVGALGGPPTPGIGFALGLERFLMLQAKRAAHEGAASEGIAVVALGEAARRRTVPLIAALRRKSGATPILVHYGDAKIAVHLRRAERAHARAALILGDDEIARSEVIVRDLQARVQRTLPCDDDPDSTADAVLIWYTTLPSAPREAA